MNYYSKKSRERLNTCDERLIELFERVLVRYDHSIICGHREKDDQNRAYLLGNSRAQWPQSKHNQLPSLAVDAGPWDKYLRDIPWEAMLPWYELATVVFDEAQKMDLKLTWGGHFSKMKKDLGHWEIIE